MSFQRLLKNTNSVNIRKMPSSLVLSALLRSGNPPQNSGDPGQCVADILKELLPIVGGQPPLQACFNGIVHVPLPKIAQRPFLYQRMQHQVHGLAAAEVHKIAWGDDATFPPPYIRFRILESTLCMMYLHVFL